MPGCPGKPKPFHRETKNFFTGEGRSFSPGEADGRSGKKRSPGQGPQMTIRKHTNGTPVWCKWRPHLMHMTSPFGAYGNRGYNARQAVSKTRCFAYSLLLFKGSETIVPDSVSAPTIHTLYNKKSQMAGIPPSGSFPTDRCCQPYLQDTHMGVRRPDRDSA